MFGHLREKCKLLTANDASVKKEQGLPNGSVKKTTTDVVDPGSNPLGCQLNINTNFECKGLNPLEGSRQISEIPLTTEMMSSKPPGDVVSILIADDP